MVRLDKKMKEAISALKDKERRKPQEKKTASVCLAKCGGLGVRHQKI